MNVKNRNITQELPKIREHRFITTEGLWRLCIEKGWYRDGSNEDYKHLISMVNMGDNLTTDDIVKIAADIISHSDLEDFMIANVCYEIERISFTVFMVHE